MTRKRKKKYWSWGCGTRGESRIRLTEVRSGRIVAVARDPGAPPASKFPYLRKWLPREWDREQAKRWAQRQSEKIEAGLSEARERARGTDPTVALLCALYLSSEAHRNKKPSGQVNDRRAAELLTRAFGAKTDVRKLGSRRWEDFIRKRGSGEIDGRGLPVSENRRRCVADRTIEADLQWFTIVCNWGTTWQLEDGRTVLDVNPIKGWKIPHEKNPVRPVATDDRYAKTMAVADQVTTQLRRDGERRTVTSWLPELLVVMSGTGRRISAVRQLRYDDLRLDVGKCGAIVWPHETDKTKREQVAPMNGEVRAAVDRILVDREVGERSKADSPYLFPSSTDPNKPLRKELATKWLLAAERVAKLPKLKKGAWHPYRRRWATARKHHPPTDRAATGGWSDTRTMMKCYTAADWDTMQTVVDDAAPVEKVQ